MKHIGFPSPADDFLESGLDLNQLMIKNAAATFFVRAQGNSMRQAGIYSGDILVVDRSLQPNINAIVVAVVNGEMLVKSFKQIEKFEETDFCLWGVVTYIIHKTWP